MENDGHRTTGGVDTVGATAQPERGLESGNPYLVGDTPVTEKQGIADKVKGMLGGHGHHTEGVNHPHPAIYGDATPGTGTPESTKVGCIDKIKAKASGFGHGHQHAERQTGVVSPSSGVGAAGNGHTVIPTRPHQGTAFESDTRVPHESEYSGTPVTDTGYGDGTSPDFNGGSDVQSTAAVHGGWPLPTRPSATSTSGGPRPTNPTGATNAEGGAVLSDHHGNLNEGLRDDNVKKDGFVSKVMDKLHSPRGKHGNTTVAQ